MESGRLMLPDVKDCKPSTAMVGVEVLAAAGGVMADVDAARDPLLNQNSGPGLDLRTASILLSPRLEEVTCARLFISE